MSVPSPALDAFAARYPHAACDYPDPADRADFWDRLLRERAAIEDDALPSAYLSEFDQGLYGGLLGGEVRFLAHPDVGWISSMVPPLLNDWSEFDRLRFDPEHPLVAALPAAARGLRRARAAASGASATSS